MDETTYSIVGADGKEYGPVSREGLRGWASEGRVRGDTTLIVHPSGGRMTARDLPGLFEGLPSPPTFAPPVDAPPAKGGKSGWVIALVVVGGVSVCGCGILGAILFPVFAQAKAAAQKTRGLSNMKQLALGTIMYSADADDHFPKGMESALAAKPYLQPYLTTITEDVFVSVNPKGGEILGDGRLSGRSVVDLLEPESTVMFYDSKPWSNDQAMIAYVDGHVRTLPSGFGEIEAAKAKDPFGGLKPKR